MAVAKHRPVLIVIAGPNGSGKTTITSKILRHEAGYFIRIFFVATSHPTINASRIAQRVLEGGHDVPIPKIISRYQKSILNCKRVAAIADRVYVYDNSVDDAEARLLFRMTDGLLFKRYTDDIPLWAQAIID